MKNRETVEHRKKPTKIQYRIEHVRTNNFQQSVLCIAGLELLKGLIKKNYEVAGGPAPTP